MIGKYVAWAATAAMISAVPALAENAQPAPAKTKDMNEMVCQKEEVLGSRLATRKICMTRSEWAERRRLDKMDIDKAQTQRGSCDKCQ